MERSKLRFQYTRKINRIDSSYTKFAFGKVKGTDLIYSLLVNLGISAFCSVWNYIFFSHSSQINTVRVSCGVRYRSVQ